MVDQINPVPMDAPDTVQPVAIDSPNYLPNITLPPNVVDFRAAKASYGLSNKTGKSQDEIKDAITQGQETDIRQDMASQLDAQKATIALDRLNKGQLTANDIHDLSKNTSPDSVFEEHFAKTQVDQIDWVKDLSKNAQDSWLYTSAVGIPQEYYNLTKTGGSNYLAFREFLNTVKENGEAAAGGVAPLAANLVMDLASLGFYSEIRMRQGDMFSSLGLGSNLKDQASTLFNLALSDFGTARTTVQNTYNKLANVDPVLAQRWIGAIIGQSQDDRTLNNIFTGVNVGGVVGSAFKTSIRKVAAATKDMVAARPAVIPPKVAAPAAAGNVSESAVQKVAIDRINEFSNQNNPVQELKDRLPGIYDVDKSAASSDPGRLGREMANRVSDVIDAQKEDFLNTVLTAQRVNKIPAPVTVEAKVRQVQEGLADRHRGLDNTVLNVSEPLYVPGHNVYAHNVAIGTADGDLFRSEEEALANAKLNGLVVKGSLIETPQNLSRQTKLNNLVSAYEALAAKAGTPEGATRARAGIELIRQKIAALPRHETGVTIETQSLKQKSLAGVSPEDAADIERFENEGGAVLERQGNGFYINKVVTLQPHEDFVRDGLITTKIGEMTTADFRKAIKSGEVSTGIPPSWFGGWTNALMGRARNPAERLSIAENEQRVIATHGPSALLGMMKRGNAPIKNVPKSEWKMFDRMMKYAQKATDESTGLPGVWFDNPGQIETWTRRNFNVDPSPEYIEAYFAYKALNVDDLHMRDLVVGGRKRDLGIEHHNIKFTDKDGNPGETGFFEGARRYELPSDSKQLMIAGDDKNSTKVMVSRFLKNREKLQEDISMGRAKLIQVADPKSRPMGDLSPRRIEYVIAYAPRHEEKPLPIAGNVNRLGGGHLVNEWPWYFKQAHVDEGVYEGDKTIMSFLTKAQAEEALPHMEEVRKLFQRHSRVASGADREAIERFEGEGGLIPHDYLQDAAEANKKTGIPFHKHYGWYFGKDKFLDVNEPIHVVPQDIKSVQIPEIFAGLKERHPELVDSTRGDGSLLGKAMVEFTQERDSEGMFTMRSLGTQQNPLFAYEPAPVLDPITAMERGYSRIARTMYMSDMQEYSMEHWLQQAAPFLETETTNTTNDLRSAPGHYFNNPRYKKGTPTEIKWQLESNRKQAIDFIGRPSDIATGIRAIGQRLADSVYRTTGGKGRVSMWLMSELPKRRDPIGFIRNMTFNPVLGLFSLPSMFTQISTFGNVLAISPRQAPASAVASLLYGWSRLNRTPGMMAYLDDLATKMSLPGFTRWKPGQFTEFVQKMEASGFHNTGNEHAYASNVLGDKVIQNAGMTILDWGRIPFNLGSGFTKIGGYATAYLEHRILKPLEPISNQESTAILRRAALLDHNMSSAFSTKLHTGAMSIPMQFQAYDLRLAEMMFGKNLTPAEKARLFTASAMMYGAVGGGLTVVGFPIANYLTKQAEIKMGYVPGDNPIADLVMAGVPAVILKYLIGAGDYAKGTLYNLSKFGNKGIDPLEQILGEDKTLRDMIGGAAGNVFYNTFQNTYGMREFIKSMATGKGGEYPLTVDDVLDNFNEISIVRNSRRLWYAFQTHKWITKNEGRIGDISKAEALTQFITGVSPKGGSDVWVQQQAIKEAGQEVRQAQKIYTKQIGRALYSLQNQDPDQAKKFFRQAEATREAYIPSEKWAESDKQAYDSFGTDLKDRLNFEMLKYFKDFSTFQKRMEKK